MTAPSFRPVVRRDVLAGVAALWLIMLVLGQGAFVYHVADSYGTPATAAVRHMKAPTDEPPSQR